MGFIFGMQQAGIQKFPYVGVHCYPLYTPAHPLIPAPTPPPPPHTHLEKNPKFSIFNKNMKLDEWKISYQYNYKNSS